MTAGDLDAVEAARDWVERDTVRSDALQDAQASADRPPTYTQDEFADRWTPTWGTQR